MIARRNVSGFTMVELLVVLAVSTIVLSLMYKVYHSQLKTHNTQQEYVELQQNLRAAMYLMERDIRMAGYDPENADIGGIMEANDGDTLITVTMDINGDEAIGGTNEQVSYRYDGTTLERNGVAFLENIDAVQFEYYDSDGGITGTLEDVRTVRVLIEDSFPTTPMVAGGDDKKLLLQSDVRCRNLVN
jgi:type IV pilus assembly protein PilW